MRSNWRERLAWFEPGVVTEVQGLAETIIDGLYSTGQDLKDDGSIVRPTGEIVLLPEDDQKQGGMVRCKVKNYTLCFTNQQHSSLPFLRNKSYVDAVLLEKITDEQWVVHIIVFQSVVTRNSWLEVKGKFKGGIVEGLAYTGILGINNSAVQTIKCYTVFRTDLLSSHLSPNPVLGKVRVGESVLDTTCTDWEKGQIEMLGDKVEHHRVLLDEENGYGRVVL